MMVIPGSFILKLAMDVIDFSIDKNYKTVVGQPGKKHPVLLAECRIFYNRNRLELDEKVTLDYTWSILL
jgi:hypothetical protein